MPSTSALVAAWLGAAVITSVTTWHGIGLIGAQVTERRPDPLDASAVLVALNSPPVTTAESTADELAEASQDGVPVGSAAVVTPGVSLPAGSSATGGRPPVSTPASNSVQPSGGSSGGISPSPTAGSPAPSQTPAGGLGNTTRPPGRASEGTAGLSPRPAAPVTTARPSSPTPPPVIAPVAEVTETYTLVGGTASLRYTARGVSVLFANPNPGFRSDIKTLGNGVRVEFRSDDHRSRVTGSWTNGPKEKVDEQSMGRGESSPKLKER